MKTSKLFFALSLCCSTLFAQQKDVLTVKQFVLDNGLTVLLNEDHSEPKMYGAVLVKAGSKNDPEHATGLAHYFEHIMFKGTDSIGTLDFASEKVYLDSILALYDILNQTTDKEERLKLQTHINNLSIKAAEYAIPNEVDKLLKKYGGTQVNAFTSFDKTAYFNVFPPNQVERWLDIYSERFRNPIFRLFQSELETVYEERNKGADQMGSKMMEDVFKLMFKKHPYRNPIIGTVEDLKNPSISKMIKFYNDYYVANNMVLILTGDFDTEKVLPMVREKFGKWRSGKVPEFPKEKYKEEPFGKREFHSGRYLPVRLGAVIYRGVPLKHPDKVALDMCCDILSYSGTGLLDVLRIENKVMEVSADNIQFNDEGVIGITFAPKIIGGSTKKAEKAIMEYVDSLKAGNFSDELLNSIKINRKKNFAQILESSYSRGQQILQAYSAGYTWNEYLAEKEKYTNIEKEEIVRAANTYFTENRLVFYNKRGLSFKAEKIKKPDYKPILPKNTEKESEYAKSLDSIPKTKATPIFVDLAKDVTYTEIKEKVHLITGNNPANDIFSMQISFGVGTHIDSLLQAVNHISELGTENRTFKEFKQAFQRIGSSMWIGSYQTGTYIYLSGFDEHLNETLRLVEELFTSVKADDKQMTKLIEDAKASKKFEKKDQNTLDNALYNYVLYGENSPYLNRLTEKELKQLHSADIVKSFQRIKEYEVTVSYAGTLSHEQVKTIFLQNINLPDSLKNEDNYIMPLNEYKENSIFLCNNSKANQVAINAYILSKKNNDTERLQSNLFNQYFGQGMSSILFQEIREFRSLSYSAYGSYKASSKKYPERKGYFTAYLSTQTDKTGEAIELLDSLINNMPEKPNRLETIKTAVEESINNSKPGFRSIPGYAYSLIYNGYKEDLRKLNLEYTQKVGFDDITKFYNRFVKGYPIIYILTGNKKKIDTKLLEKYGKLIEIDKDKLIKQ